VTRRWGTWLGVAVLSVGTVVAAVSFRAFLLPASDLALEEGPVVALGSAPGRVELAAEIAAGEGPGRHLYLSHPPAHEAAPDGRCADRAVTCLWPEPVSTWGEAQALAQLDRREGWSGVTVVTDDFHVPRSRSLLRRCLEAPVHVVGTGDGARVPVALAMREALATLVSAVAYRDC
jgi:hypothetical protein